MPHAEAAQDELQGLNRSQRTGDGKRDGTRNADTPTSDLENSGLRNPGGEAAASHFNVSASTILPIVRSVIREPYRVRKALYASPTACAQRYTRFLML